MLTAITLRAWTHCYLWERKFKQSLNSKIRLTRYVNSGDEKESSGDFLLHCPQFVNKKDTFLSTIDIIDHKLLDNLKTVLSNTLLLRNTLCNSNESVLNRVGHVGFVGHSRGSFLWVIIVGYSRGSFLWVKLVGHSRGSNSWVILGHSLPLFILVPRTPGYSEIPKLPDNFS